MYWIGSIRNTALETSKISSNDMFHASILNIFWAQKHTYELNKIKG